MNTKKKMGLFSIILMGFNAIVGTGIFLLPGKVYQMVGPSALLVTLFDAILVVSIAMCFAEVGGIFKKNGGPYVYAKEAFGDFVGFEVGFMKWAIAIIAWATMAVGFSEALQTILPQGIIKDPSFFKAIVVTIIIGGLSILNLCGIKLSVVINNIVTVGKLLPLIVFISVGLFFINGANFEPFFNNLTVSTGEVMSNSAAVGAAALTIFYAFTGFESMAVISEDMENPERDVPKAIILVILFVSLFYILILGNSIGILGGDLSITEAPVQESFYRTIGPAGKYLVAAGTLISIGGINIASSILTPRSGSAIADDGLIPRAIGKKNSKDVPYVAIIITGAITLCLALYGALIGSFATLAAISVVSRFVQYVPTCLSVIVLRRKRPELKSTFRVPLGPVIPIFAVVVSFWLLYNSSLEKIYIGLGGLVVGAIVYLLMRLTLKERN